MCFMPLLFEMIVNNVTAKASFYWVYLSPVPANLL